MAILPPEPPIKDDDTQPEIPLPPLMSQRANDLRMLYVERINGGQRQALLDSSTTRALLRTGHWRLIKQAEYEGKA